MTSDVVLAAAAQASEQIEQDDYEYDDGYPRVTLEEAIGRLPLDMAYEVLDDMQRELLTLYTPEQVKAWVWRRKRRVRDRHKLAAEVSKLIGWRLPTMFPKITRDYVTGRTITNWVKDGAEEAANKELEYQTEMGRFELMNDYSEAKQVAVSVLADCERELANPEITPHQKQKWQELRLQAARDLVAASAEVANFEGYNKQEQTLNVKGRIDGQVEHVHRPELDGMSKLMLEAKQLQTPARVAVGGQPIHALPVAAEEEPIDADWAEEDDDGD